MPEVQKHGFAFEEWIKQTYFEKFVSNYSQKWDVPSQYNIKSIIPHNFRNLPVSIKTAKNGSPIGLGDAIRQYNIDSDFLLIVGFWKQFGDSKYFISVETQKIEVKFWRKLWAPLKKEDLFYLDTTIKDIRQHYSTVRIKAQTIKNNFPKTSIVLNPKIDSNRQRRLQCSLPFGIFWQDIIHETPYENTETSFLGIKVPNPFKSPTRTFNY